MEDEKSAKIGKGKKEDRCTAVSMMLRRSLSSEPLGWGKKKRHHRFQTPLALQNNEKINGS